MSELIIKDGQGKGFSAEVDDHGRLSVKSSFISHMSHHATCHKNSYMTVHNTTLQGTSETPCVLLLNSDPTKDLELYWVRVSSTAAVEVNMYSGNTYTSGGTEITYTNLNLGTPNSSVVTAYEGGASGDLVLDTTVNNLLDGGYINANSQNPGDYEGGVVLPFSQSISFKVIGAASDKIKIMLAYALHEKGTRL